MLRLSQECTSFNWYQGGFLTSDYYFSWYLTSNILILYFAFVDCCSLICTKYKRIRTVFMQYFSLLLTSTLLFSQAVWSKHIEQL